MYAYMIFLLTLCKNYLIMSMLRVDEITARRLADFKGKKTYNVIINEMIDFFVNTGMRVTDTVAAPIIVIQQESAKMQKMVRAIEAKQNTLLKDILEKANFLIRESQQETHSAPRPTDDENYMDVAEVQELMESYKNLQTEVSKKESQLKELRIELDNLKKKQEIQVPEEPNKMNKVIISECLDKLVEKKQGVMFDNDKYSIRKSDFNMCINTIREELNK